MHEMSYIETVDVLWVPTCFQTWTSSSGLHTGVGPNVMYDLRCDRREDRVGLTAQRGVAAIVLVAPLVAGPRAVPQPEKLAVAAEQRLRPLAPVSAPPAHACHNSRRQ